MQHSGEYKRRSLAFSVDGRQLRAYRRSIDRKNARDGDMMKRRQIGDEEGKKNIPGRKIREISPVVEEEEKKLDKSERRRQQLLEYKKRKAIEKQLQQAKPVFKVSRVNHSYNPFPITESKKTAPNKQKNAIAPPATIQRVTRSMAKKPIAVGEPKVLPKHQPVRKTDKKMQVTSKTTKTSGTTQFSKSAEQYTKDKEKRSNLTLDEVAPKEEKRPTSFAPAGFKFTAPKIVVSTSSEETSLEIQPFEERILSGSVLEISNGIPIDDMQLNKTDCESKDAINQHEDSFETPAVKTSTRKICFSKVEDYISPYVTTTRGSGKKKKVSPDNRSFKLDKLDLSSKTLDSQNNSLVEKVQSVEVGVAKDSEDSREMKNVSSDSSLDKFKLLVKSQRKEFQKRIDLWKSIRDEIPDLPDNVVDEINCVIGMTELLMNQRFVQFENLIGDAEFNRQEKKITCEDLQGFWEMVGHQVEDIDAKYKHLDCIKEEGWVIRDVSPAKKMKKAHSRGFKPKKSSKKPSKLREHIVAARKQKQAQKDTEMEGEGVLVVNTPQPQVERRKSLRNRVQKEIAVEEVVPEASPKENSQSVNVPALKNAHQRRSQRRSVFNELTNSPTPKVSKSALKRNSLSYLLVPTVTSEENRISKPRRSVRFLSEEYNTSDDKMLYRTTPFITKQKSSSSSTSSSEGNLSLSDSFTELFGNAEVTNCSVLLEKMSFTTPKSIKKSRAPSLLHLGLGNISTVATDADLISFSPLESTETKISENSTPRLTRSQRKKSLSN